MEDFKELKISKELIKNLERHGIVKPTIVQQKAIPPILEGRDVIVQSETGSGKTIGFAIPTITNAKPLRRVQVLVITPTRELAKQVAEEYRKFATRGLRTALVYGGVSLERQANQVRQADIVVGTPGRLLDLLRRRALNLTYTKYLVLDEADRMLDMGFIDDINAIIKHLPKIHQTLLFSATINSRVARIKKEYLVNPVDIFLENMIKRGVLEQRYYDIPKHLKLSLLVHLLKKENPKLSLIFCNTKRGTRYVTRVLKHNGFKAEVMNGDMSQHMREKTLKDFALGDINILVATDVAARGIHVEDITHVFNYDLPNDPEGYTHRIGRTARQGNKGTAITLLSDKDYPNMTRVQRDTDHKITRTEPPYLDKIKMPPRKPRRDNRRRRRS